MQGKTLKEVAIGGVCQPHGVYLGSHRQARGPPNERLLYKFKPTLCTKELAKSKIKVKEGTKKKKKRKPSPESKKRQDPLLS